MIYWMIYQCKNYEREHPQQCKAGQLGVGEVNDADKGQKFYFTIVEKEGDWFGISLVNLVLRHTSKPYGDQYHFFCEKNVEVDEAFNHLPVGDSNKAMRMERMKLVARQNCYLTVVFTTEKEKFEQFNFKFRDIGIAEQWEALLKSKKEAAKKANDEKENLTDQLKKANVEVRTLKDQLRKERAEKDIILTELNLMTEECSRFKALANTLQQHVLEQEEEVCKKRKYIEGLQEENARLRQQIGNLKNSLQNLERGKLQAQLRAVQFQGRLKKQELAHNNQLSALREQRQRLQSSKLIEQKLTSQLINKIIRKNKQFSELNKRLNNELQLSRSVIIDNEQDYRSFYGHERQSPPSLPSRSSRS